MVDIQLIDIEEEKIDVPVTLHTLNRGRELEYEPHRLDGHPAWNRDYRTIFFQAVPEGVPPVYLADVGELLG